MPVEQLCRKKDTFRVLQGGVLGSKGLIQVHGGIFGFRARPFRFFSRFATFRFVPWVLGSKLGSQILRA